MVPLGYGFDSFGEVAEHLGKNLKETGYKLQDKKHISDDGKVWFYTNKTEKYLKVFVLIKVNQLKKEQCKELDYVTETFLNEILGEEKRRFFIFCTMYLSCMCRADKFAISKFCNECRPSKEKAVLFASRNLF